MNRFKYIYIMALLLVACNESGDEFLAGNEIAMSARIVENAETRALSTYEILGKVPSEEYPVNALLCFSEVSGIYKHQPAAPSYLPCHTTISYTSANKTYPKTFEVNDGNGNIVDVSPRYPIGDAAYCVGLHPATGWTFDDPNYKVASHAIDNTSDIMFAPEISGTYGTQFGAQTYTHLQAWLKIVLCAMTHEAIEMWGGIKSISLKGAANVNIDLAATITSESFIGANKKITYTGEKDIHVITESDNYTLDILLKDAGSFFYIPLHDANGILAENTLKIVTENIGEREVKFKLTDKNGYEITNIYDAIGKLYILELHFQHIDQIKASCTLESWEAIDDNLYME